MPTTEALLVKTPNKGEEHHPPDFYKKANRRGGVCQTPTKGKQAPLKNTVEGASQPSLTTAIKPANKKPRSLLNGAYFLKSPFRGIYGV